MPRSLAIRMSRPATSLTCDRAGRTGQGRVVKDLHRIDHAHVRPFPFQGRDHSFQVGISNDRDTERMGPEPLCPQPDLSRGSSPETYRTSVAGRRQVRQSRCGEGRLADPGAPPIARASQARVRRPTPGRVRRFLSCIRPTFGASISPRGTGVRARPESAAEPRARGAAARFSSAIVFHSPQPGQRPCHFGLSCPQEVQAKMVAERAIQARLRAAVDGFALVVPTGAAC